LDVILSLNNVITKTKYVLRPYFSHPGDDVTLSCQADGSSISFAEWTRPDLKPEYILVYRSGSLDPDNQHPSFKDRVKLVDRDLKDGDVSLTLKNVSSIDNGTYECRVKTNDTDQIRFIGILRLTIRTVRLQGGAGEQRSEGRRRVFNSEECEQTRRWNIRVSSCIS
uniref:Ig-like domain-containing protein n=1 Tax=Sander lucioperca TaxID=283035 RepID=A0A8D0DE65_SANLU